MVVLDLHSSGRDFNIKGLLTSRVKEDRGKRLEELHTEDPVPGSSDQVESVLYV